jgi:cytoplasmic iron level regulating protein YaaA (DUF328/UPF0246 family)
MTTKPRLQLILSPAKTMDFSPCAVADKAGSSEAVGLQRVDELASVMAKQSKAQLKDCLGVSDAIANENYERFQSWSTAEPRQAVVAYSGFAYAKLDARTLTEEQLRVGQKRLLILSGMWGPVRPLDQIKPYRLEMACKKLAPPYNKLALYWRDLSTETLLEGYGSGGDRVLVNVASDEYASAIDFAAVKKAGVRVVKIDFWQGGKKATTCVEINQCVGCTRQFFTKLFLGDDAAVLARSSGEEPASPRHRAGVASMAWRTTRRFSTTAP